MNEAQRSEESTLTDLLYSAHFLPGRGRRGGNQSVGVIHAVKPLPENTGGDNFNEAACGKNPTGISLGWFDTQEDINCDKCKKILGI